MCFFTFFQFYLLEIPNCCKIMCLIKNLSHISNKKSGKRSRPSIRLYTPKKNHTPPPSKKIEIDVWDQAKTSSPLLRNFQPANFSPPLKKNISRRMSAVKNIVVYKVLEGTSQRNIPYAPLTRMNPTVNMLMLV